MLGITTKFAFALLAAFLMACVVDGAQAHAPERVRASAKADGTALVAGVAVEAAHARKILR